jgi:diaminohydroxyphosphoribosylaminopyrimidine deaminase/5-amino-6-(5-phosphoribosylamino)uracil reductase
MPFDAADDKWMSRALALAARGRWGTAPNPRVGCIIVHEGQAIAEGWHARIGGPHAEAAALASLAADDARLATATAYVTLEPCNHHGRTSPCSERLLQAGIPRIVVGMVDPDPRVSGSGIHRLRAAGVQVDLMGSHPSGRWLNRRFLSSLERRRPWVVLKCAVSADGHADPPREAGQMGSLPITAPKLRKLTHQWRAEESAILVGAGTVNTDDPRLDVREALGDAPFPVVMDPDGLTSPEAHVYAHPQACVLGGPAHLPAHVQRLSLSTDDHVAHVLEALQGMGCRSVLVEGGPHTLAQFLESGLWDEARWCRSAVPTGGGLKAPILPSEAVLRGTHPFGDDVVDYFLNPVSAKWTEASPPPTLTLPLPS